ncbi:unnamed protein product [Owenia fusiformis]|uniref:Uncharacterized protein n=1 Tax=Owenia fusiformis TaxID=6347 RepID=A0A8J1TKK0_OWEFU|nr:unnamed protein product [Owenia fusiformis]
MSTKNNVKVVVRVRPKLSEDKLWVDVVDDTTLQTVNPRDTTKTDQYEFARVFNSDCSQVDVYNNCAIDSLKHLMQGLNVSIFAYGPTGAGKTHTMLGTPTAPGIIPRSVNGLFQLIEESKEEGWKTEVSYSYLEIYNEKVHDLLVPKEQDLAIRCDLRGKIFVTDLAKEIITNKEEFNKSFGLAANNRTTASTLLNEHSSRSHSILILNVTRTQAVEPFARRHGKMYLTDLAGSENNRMTGNEGQRMRESGAIHFSLLALSNVVEALNKGQARIPYRDSKLTRLLQDALGGNSHSCLIINVAPEESHLYETQQTLLFARKSKRIINTVQKNETFVTPKMSAKKRRSEGGNNEAPIPKMPSLTPYMGRQKSSGFKTPFTPRQVQAIKEPVPFLSPLLRMSNKQNVMEESVSGMNERLLNLESTLMAQMREMNETLQTSHMNASHMNASHMNATCAHEMSTMGSSVADDALKEINNKLQELKEQQQKMQQQQQERAPSKGVPSGLADVTNSPLFCNNLPPKIKRRGFKSSAAPRNDDDFLNTPTKALRSSVINPEAQKRHNDDVLKLLNTGSIKELQVLQKVGQKRAELIKNWRQLHGDFTKVEDLTKVPGLNKRYVEGFLLCNLVVKVT